MHKSQSAMEYLMTYGWAILILAVAITVLAYLGVFNYNSLIQKAQPGACSVYRPASGVGNVSKSQQAFLTGACSNVEPEYVSSMVGYSNAITGKNILPSTISQFTITVWVKPSLTQSTVIASTSTGTNCPLNSGQTCLSVVNNELYLGGVGCSNANTGSFTIANNRWSFIAATFKSGGTSYVYINGTQEGSATGVTMCSYSDPFLIGNSGIGGSGFIGNMSNMQVYSVALSQNAITALYLEGIGGVPTNINNLLGWWPLNGNTNDYSGNRYNATANSISYTTNWQSGYSVP